MQISDTNLEKLTNNQWINNQNAIHKTFTFSTYSQVIAFTNKVFESAEKLNHHPDLGVFYGRVEVSIGSHEERCVTELCFKLAQAIDFSIIS